MQWQSVLTVTDLVAYKPSSLSYYPFIEEVYRPLLELKRHTFCMLMYLERELGRR